MNSRAAAAARYLPIAARLAAFALAALSVSAAAAQGILPHGAVGSSHAPTVIQGFYEDTTNTTSVTPPTPAPCSATSFCTFLFRGVPTGKQLIVTQVSCGISISAGDLRQAVLGAQRPNGTGPVRFQFLIPSKLGSSDTSINNTTLQVYNSRDVPVLSLLSNAVGDISGYCTIAGQLFDAPP